MRTLFRSAHIFPELLGVAEPNNMATIFHEALHAYTRVTDQGLKHVFNCTDPDNPAASTYPITAYLLQFVKEQLLLNPQPCSVFQFWSPPDDPKQ